MRRVGRDAPTALVIAMLILISSALVSFSHENGTPGIMTNVLGSTPTARGASSQSNTWNGSQTWPAMDGRLYHGDVIRNPSNYWIATRGPANWFTSNQMADVELSGFGFNNASGALVFYHAGDIASDGVHLLLSDPDNNRILIWNKLPTSNVPPDLVLGQKNFTSNLSGNGLGQLDWPLGMSSDGRHLVVADADNNRVLIWNRFPTRNGQPADLVMNCCQWFGLKNGIPSPAQNWPWAVWTNGTKLVVTATLGGYIFVWNSFPTHNDQRPDLYLTGSGLGQSKLGTPRSIATNGHDLVVTDESARLADGGVTTGTWFWKTFPIANDTRPDFVMTSPTQGQVAGEGNITMWGTFTPEGKFIAAGADLYIWNKVPQNTTDRASLIVGQGCGLGYLGVYRFCFGSPGSDVAYAGGHLYVAQGYGSDVLVFNSVPTSSTQVPDFAIGASSVYANTGLQYSIISNPSPVTDGQSLFVAGEYGMFVWKGIPDQSGARPDIFLDNPGCASGSPVWCFFTTQAFQPRGEAYYGGTFAVAGPQGVWLWKESPALGQNPDVVFFGHIGSATFNSLYGVAMDAKHFYLADQGANKIWVWNGLPGPDTDPVATINIAQPWQMASDGNYLVVATGFQDRVAIYRVASISSGAQPSVITLNDPSASGGAKFPGIRSFQAVDSVALGGGHLFVTDTGSNRVVAWKSIQDAIDGKPPDTVLGQPDFQSSGYGNGPSQLFIPAYLAWDGSHLWVGETKFNDLLVRYTAAPVPGNQTLLLGVDRQQLSLLAITNNTVSGVAFNPGLKALRFVANASSPGSTKLLFPNRLLNGTLTAAVDGASVPAVVAPFNSTYIGVQVNYPAGQHRVQVWGVKALVPKGPSNLAFFVKGSNLIDPFSQDYTINPHNSNFPYLIFPSGQLNLTASVTPLIRDGNLTIEYRMAPPTSPQGPFTPWKIIKSSAHGSARMSYLWTTPKNATYEFRAVWEGDSIYEASTSATFVLQVPQFVSAVVPEFVPAAMAGLFFAVLATVLVLIRIGFVQGDRPRT